MKLKIVGYFFFSLALIFSCSEEKRDTLLKLKQQRLELDKKITELEKEFGQTEIVKKVVPVAIKMVQQGEFKHYIKVQGEVESDDNVMINPSIPGEVKSVNVRKGR